MGFYFESIKCDRFTVFNAISPVAVFNKDGGHSCVSENSSCAASLWLEWMERWNPHSHPVYCEIPSWESFKRSHLLSRVSALCGTRLRAIYHYVTRSLRIAKCSHPFITLVPRAWQTAHIMTGPWVMSTYVTLSSCGAEFNCAWVQMHVRDRLGLNWLCKWFPLALHSLSVFCVTFFVFLVPFIDLKGLIFSHVSS